MIWLVQLVFDCRDPDAIMQFWGQALGYRNTLIGASAAEVEAFRAEHPQFDGRGRIDDLDLRRPPVYIQRVPEPKDGRNGVRLEISVGDEARASFAGRLQGLGAAPGPTEGELHDVEGNEFAVVSAADDATPRLRSVVVDSLDPQRQLAFWSAATGYVACEGRCDPPQLDLHWDGEAFALRDQRLQHITGAGADPGPAPFDLVPGLAFVEAHEPKMRKNRLHVDLNSTDVQSDRERLISLGASVLRWDTEHVLADPEGNEFCLSGMPPTR